MNFGINPTVLGKTGSQYDLTNDLTIIDSALSSRISDFNNCRLLISGCAGFLGFNFLNYFYHLQKKHNIQFSQIIAVDNFVRGEPDWLRVLADKFKSLKVINADILNAEFNTDFHYIIHAASIASPIFYRQFPIETIRVNSVGTDKLLSLALKSKEIKSFLFFSSSEIYGDPDPSFIPTDESYNGNVSCTGPRACYDESKRIGETICYSYYQKYSLPIKIVRPFNNYGPGLKLSDRRVIPDFYRSIFKDNKIVLLSDGLATRTFCYVSDAVAGYLLTLLSSCDGEAFNIGTENPEISMRDLASIIRDITGANASIEFAESHDTNYLQDNPNRRCPNIKKAQAMLGYAPQVSLEDGLTRTFHYYQSFSDLSSVEAQLPL